MKVALRKKKNNLVARQVFSQIKISNAIPYLVFIRSQK